MREVVLLALVAAVGSTSCQPDGPSRIEVSADSAAGEVSFRLAGPNEAAILVPVRINGTGPYEFVLDTGATLTCVDQALADSLALPHPPGTIGLGAGIGSAGAMRVVSIDSLAVGATRAYDLMGCALDLSQLQSLGLEARGLLGLNVLKAFHVELDFDRHVLILRP